MFVTRQIIILLYSIWAKSLFCGCDSNLETRARYIQLMGKLKPLNTRDRLTTRLNYVGANLKSTKNLIIYSSITTNEECVLKRFDQVEERCEELARRVCRQGSSTYNECISCTLIQNSIFVLLKNQHRKIILFRMHKIRIFGTF